MRRVGQKPRLLGPGGHVPLSPGLYQWSGYGRQRCHDLAVFAVNGPIGQCTDVHRAGAHLASLNDPAPRAGCRTYEERAMATVPAATDQLTVTADSRLSDDYLLVSPAQVSGNPQWSVCLAGSQDGTQL